MPATHTTAFALVDPVLLVYGPHASSVSKKVIDPLVQKLKDVQWSGFYKIDGTLKVDDTPDDIPVHRLVILFAEPLMLRVASTWSDPVTGAYEFLYLRGDYKYTVLGMDYAHDYRGVVADNLTPDPM